MKTMLFLLICGMTFCLPFKNKPVSSEATELGQSAGTGELTYAAKTSDSLAIEVEDIGEAALAEATNDEPAFAEASAGKSDTISFATQIQPILQTRCNPCHFPGGKMYEKMPFDQAKTILDHPEGVLKRFTDETENKLLRQFINEAGK